MNNMIAGRQGMIKVKLEIGAKCIKIPDMGMGIGQLANMINI